MHGRDAFIRRLLVLRCLPVSWVILRGDMTTPTGIFPARYSHRNIPCQVLPPEYSLPGTPKPPQSIHPSISDDMAPTASMSHSRPYSRCASIDSAARPAPYGGRASLL